MQSYDYEITAQLFCSEKNTTQIVPSVSLKE